jgi:hypothetical protein
VSNPTALKELFAASAMDADGELDFQHIDPKQEAPTIDLAVGPELDFTYFGPNRFVVRRLEHLCISESVRGKSQVESEVLQHISRGLCNGILNRRFNAWLG